MRLISNEELLCIAGGSTDDSDLENNDGQSDSPDGSSNKNTTQHNQNNDGAGGGTDVICIDKVSTVTTERSIKAVEFGWTGLKIEYQGGETKTETSRECTGPQPKDSGKQKK